MADFLTYETFLDGEAASRKSFEDYLHRLLPERHHIKPQLPIDQSVADNIPTIEDLLEQAGAPENEIFRLISPGILPKDIHTAAANAGLSVECLFAGLGSVRISSYGSDFRRISMEDILEFQENAWNRKDYSLLQIFGRSVVDRVIGGISHETGQPLGIIYEPLEDEEYSILAQASSNLIIQSRLAISNMMQKAQHLLTKESIDSHNSLDEWKQSIVTYLTQRYVNAVQGHLNAVQTAYEPLKGRSELQQYENALDSYSKQVAGIPGMSHTLIGEYLGGQSTKRILVLPTPKPATEMQAVG